MKIQHYAIIFLFIIIPFSIVCRDIINKKILNLRDETRYNNIIDNATYDATSIIHDMAGTEEPGQRNIIFGKNVPISENVANAAVERFFNTLCVDFNLPMNQKIGEKYFDRYIPAIVIVGYDGLYVYSCEETSTGYKFKMKPKIPYSASYDLGGGITAIINYTLDNYVSIYFATSSAGNEEATFGKGYFGNDTLYTREIKGYVGTVLDTNNDHIDDFLQYGADPSTMDYPPTINPHGLHNYSENNYGNYATGYLSTVVAANDANTTKQADLNKGSLSYFMFEWAREKLFDANSIPVKLAFLFHDDPNNGDLIQPNIDSSHQDYKYSVYRLPIITFNGVDYSNPENFWKYFDFSKVNVDYQFDRDKHMIGSASKFHQMRRQVIVKTITNVLTDEFNEHNRYAKMLGVTYDFYIPSVSNETWNNTINDVSVLSFMQGMPIGGDIYYNNFSLGGARIVVANNIFCEVVLESEGYGGASGSRYHRVYHKPTCQCLPRDAYGDILYCDQTRRELYDVNNPANDASLGFYPKNYVNQRYETAVKYTSGKFTAAKYGGYEPGLYPDPDDEKIYRSSGVIYEVLNEEQAAELGFYPCSVCM